MKIITEPKITVVGSTEFVDHPDYDIPPDGNDALRLAAFSAKACYDSFGVDGRSNRENQEAILEHRHGSVMEHVHVSLFIEGISRGLSLELNRHRSFNISQRSTRYTREDDAAFVLDPYYAELYKKHQFDIDSTGVVSYSSHDEEWSTEVTLVHDHLHGLMSAQQSYVRQVELLESLNPFRLSGFDLRKWARGKARNMLPHALETRGTWTNNLRGWRWFIESRSSRHAEPEIRILANEILHVLWQESPLHFSDFTMRGKFQDIPEWQPEYSKV
jgi:thymidylate synthase (FAD)